MVEKKNYLSVRSIEKITRERLVCISFPIDFYGKGKKKIVALGKQNQRPNCQVRNALEINFTLETGMTSLRYIDNAVSVVFCGSTHPLTGLIRLRMDCHLYCTIEETKSSNDR